MSSAQATGAVTGKAARRPQVWSIPAHRGFADALVAGLLPRYADGDLGLARLTLLLPNQRAARTITEAFIRNGAVAGADGTRAGLLLPRMVAVGDLDLDETLGALLDPIGAADHVLPAADATRRWLHLAELMALVEPEEAPGGAARLRRARNAAQTIDRLLVEDVSAADLLSDQVKAIVGEQAEHWVDATRDFLKLQALWRDLAGQQGVVDAPMRRNALFDHAASAWKLSPPPHAVLAVGITSASPALARLLRVVADLPQGGVVLPDLDLSLDDAVWDELGQAGVPDEPGGAPFGRDDVLTHPQYHLKLLLNRMGLSRKEVQPWHRAGVAAAPPERSKAISALFLPPKASARWVDLPPEKRRLAAVRLMEAEHPGEEAQAIAILMREALETPERRVALITPNRGLAARVVAHLHRWGIMANDTAGRPLPQTAAGRLFLLLAEVMAEDAPPVPLIALLSHPLARGSMGRGLWLDHVRTLDRALRGPRPGVGTGPIRAVIDRLTKDGRGRLRDWWDEVEAILNPLLAMPADAPLAEMLDALVLAAETLCGEAIWAEAPGRALSTMVEDLREAAREVGTMLPRRDITAVLRDAMDMVAVRPPWGGHGRVAIYGLLEARMSRADLVICGGLTEGNWPAAPATDALLPPAVLRHLGVPGADFRIGLAAHDLAGALGAPQVVLSWARRDEGGPVIPSRFVLRVQAMLGADLAERHRETRAIALAQAIDAPNASHPAVPPAPRPAPMPSAEQRRVDVRVTALDGLRADPYGFYAQAILRLSKLDALDAEPSPAWRGTAVHKILENWHKDGAVPGTLCASADRTLDMMSAHPLARSLWRPRLLAALNWIDQEMVAITATGRRVIGTELSGEMVVDGIRVHGRIDRLDRLPDGSVAVVDYKTGTPPSGKKVEAGFALQLGLMGMIAAQDGFKARDGSAVGGTPARFEYWSLARAKKGGGFGYVEEPVLDGKKKSGLPRDEFLDRTEVFLRDAIAHWLIGNDPFTAMLRPDMVGYNDYDQLMRLDEWIGWLGDDDQNEGTPA
ncbi:double-strand break repair protein AddB [Novosphingobium ovatum]|uniref:double-strand break repair protein AddB n=1 Tax=Novosphingobium ovatum TaxID=1908523 RepID=UPI0029FF3D58|nr:double-strand break repair protein AddB [Novosphingobium ovatum]